MGNKLVHPDLKLPPEKHVMVTGGNTGIGYETAKSLAQMGAKVYIACRSEDKAKAAIERMQKEHHDEMHQKKLAKGETEDSADVEMQPLNVHYIHLDLASLESTMAFIQETKHRMSSLNILVCNAGIGFAKQGYTCDNLESHFQVNYLSHLLVVLHLMPLLRFGAPDSRIVLLSSTVHSSGKLDLNNMQWQKSYSRMGAYASSKAFMVMAAYFLARRLEGTNVCTYAVDPGMVDTEIAQNFSDWKMLSFFAGVSGKLGMLRSPKDGAATSTVACVDPELSGKTAVFMKNCRPATCASSCRDEAKQELLWQYSLACLNKFISDDVLKECFPSASPDLLTITKDAKPVEENITKQERPDDKENPEEDASATVSDKTPGMQGRSGGEASLEQEGASAWALDECSKLSEGAAMSKDEVQEKTGGDKASLENKEAAKIVPEEFPETATDAGHEGKGKASEKNEAVTKETKDEIAKASQEPELS